LSHPSPRARALLSVWFVVHVLMVVNYVLPWEEARLLDPVSKPYVHALLLKQEWNMFRAPSRWNKFLVHEGVRADGSVFELEPQRTKPETPFFKLVYDRRTKVHFVVAFERAGKEIFRPDYAAYLCREHPEAERVLLTKRSVKHLKPRQWRKDPDQERTEVLKPVFDLDCSTVDR
jgi:hypothetical protein